MDYDVSPGRNTTALSWYPASFGLLPRLYWFTRRESDGKLEYRYATSFPENCTAVPLDTCKTNWAPDVASDGNVVPNSVGGDGAPAADWYSDENGAHRLIVVYKDTNSKLRFQTLTVLGWLLQSWTGAGYVGSGAETISGAPAAVAFNGEIYVFALASSGNLLQWKLSPSGVWSAPDVQSWSGGAPISARFGIGITRGYIKNGSSATEHVVAAIPLQSPIGQVELAWKDLTTGQWTRLPDTQWLRGKAITKSQPGIAYVPFDYNESLSIEKISDGRFYLAWSPTDDATTGQPRGVFAAQTEGNDMNAAATDRRLAWRQQSIFVQNTWAYAYSNVSLLYDLAYDRNLRGAFTFTKGGGSPRSLRFFPVADGIIPNILRDQNDYSVILANLACAIGRQPCM
jgi:hypothetical protein